MAFPPTGAEPTVPVVTTRYGVFLLPDPATSAAVTAVTTFIRAQYGLISAGAFPPHVTLSGSLPLSVEEDLLVQVLDARLNEAKAVTVQNSGVRTLGDVVVYDVHELDGSPNTALRDLAVDLNTAVLPLLAATGGIAADLNDAGRFHAHLSLASHELFGRPSLRDEIAEFARALPVTVPAQFLGDTIALYRFEHPTWDGPWWTSMRCDHIRTWRLAQK